MRQEQKHANAITSKLNGRRILETIVEGPSSDYLTSLRLKLDDDTGIVIRTKHDNSLAIEPLVP